MLELLNKIRYPLILLDKEKTQSDLMVITLLKPKISFSISRLAGNRELTGLEFCDSNGQVFVLEEIRLGKRHFNLWNVPLNNFKHHVWGEYRFKKVPKKLKLVELKRLANELMKIEIVESAQGNLSSEIDLCKTYEEIILQFGFGAQY